MDKEKQSDWDRQYFRSRECSNERRDFHADSLWLIGVTSYYRNTPILPVRDQIFRHTIVGFLAAISSPVTSWVANKIGVEGNNVFARAVILVQWNGLWLFAEVTNAAVWKLHEILNRCATGTDRVLGHRVPNDADISVAKTRV